MTTMLRQVLNAFEDSAGPRSLGKLAKELDIAPGMLEGMIDYWVRKGKLREAGSGTATCTTCGKATSCPFIMKLPRSYELATGDTPPCEREAKTTVSTGGCPRCNS